MYLLDLLLVTVLSWPVYPGETGQEYTCIIILLWEKASIFIHIPHQARTLLMASITSSSHRWVRSIGHSQSCYHLKPFIPLHSPSFLDILSVPCPLSVSSNPSQSHIDLHDTLPDVLFFSFQTHPIHAHHTHHKHTHNTHILTHSLYFLLHHLSLIYTHTYIHTTTQPQHLSFLDIARVFTWASIYLMIAPGSFLLSRPSWRWIRSPLVQQLKLCTRIKPSWTATISRRRNGALLISYVSFGSAQVCTQLVLYLHRI